MNETALKEILNGHIKYVALIVVIINALGIVVNAYVMYLLNRRFRRLEVPLKALEAHDKARVDYLHPRKADIALELYKKCAELGQGLSWFYHVAIFAQGQSTESLYHDLSDMRSESIKQLLALRTYNENNRAVFSENLPDLVKEFMEHVGQSVSEKAILHKLDGMTVLKESEERLAAIQLVIKTILEPQAEQKKSLPG